MGLEPNMVSLVPGVRSPPEGKDDRALRLSKKLFWILPEESDSSKVLVSEILSSSIMR